jgi:GT2 family glycosyltransferase
MKRARYYLRRALTDPVWLLQAIKTAYRLWREQGNLVVLAYLAPNRFSDSLYHRWLKRYPIPAAKIVGKQKFSLLLAVEDSSQALVGRTIASIRRQTCLDWELLIACPDSPATLRAAMANMAGKDTRTRFFDIGGTIVEQWNQLMTYAAGSHVVPLSPRFCLHPELLAHLTEAFANPALQCVFWDTDQIDERQQRYNPYFRPQWNLTLARAYPPYVEIIAISRTLLLELQGFDTACGAACGYDLLLRTAERLDERQYHRIPLVLSHQQARRIAAATDAQYEFCLQAHLRRCGIDAQLNPMAGGALQIRFALPANPPSVAIIMSTRDGGSYLHKAVTSVLRLTDYPSFTLHIIDNDSCDPATLAQLETYAREPRCRIVRDPRPFNFSALNNNAIAKTTDTLVCLLNDDIEVISPNWLTDLAAAALQPGIGAVGARLWYPDGSLQHGGVILGYGGGAGHALKFHRRPAKTDFDPAALMREFSAVTAACLVTRRSNVDAVGGLDEHNFQVNFNDVDFCLKLRELGYRILYIPTAELWHHESASRGADLHPTQAKSYSGEVAMLRTRWAKWIADDPAYNPNLSLRREDYSLAWPPRHAQEHQGQR